jgi:hypothetical protein
MDANVTPTTLAPPTMATATTMAAPTAMASLGQGSLEGLIASQQIWTAGMQDIAATMAATSQAQLTRAIAAFKALSGVKSLPEALELQSHYARGWLDHAMADSGKLTAASMKLAADSIAPITRRMTLAAEVFKPHAD